MQHLVVSGLKYIACHRNTYISALSQAGYPKTLCISELQPGGLYCGCREIPLRKIMIPIGDLFIALLTSLMLIYCSKFFIEKIMGLSYTALCRHLGSYCHSLFWRHIHRLLYCNQKVGCHASLQNH